VLPVLQIGGHLQLRVQLHQKPDPEQARAVAADRQELEARAGFLQYEGHFSPRTESHHARGKFEFLNCKG
jgi:hypothetical protein